MYDSNQMDNSKNYKALKPYIDKYNFNLFLVCKEFKIFNVLLDNPEHFELLYLDDNFAILKLVEE
jgi:hypothetical protein